jgi:hypothetical protein
MLVNLRLLLKVLFGELVQLIQQGLNIVLGLRPVPSNIVFPLLLLHPLPLSLPLQGL